MGILYKEEQVSQKTFQGYKCNKCKEEFTDVLDTQEFLHFSDVGGYASKLGDGVRWSITLCQDCWLDLLGNYLDSQEMED